MKAVVTGGAGFIGSHLVDALIEGGWEVHVIDNLSTGRLENLKNHNQNPSFRFHESDIRDLDAITPIFEGVQRVFHLAALADIVPSINNPLEYYSSNVTGTSHVLEASRKSGVKRFIYAASSSSYGLATEFPTPESAEIRCEYPYALSKYLGELTVLHWASVYGFPALCTKFFNIYGPRARTSGTYGAVFGVFLAQKMNQQPYTIVGDGKQTRDFTYVTDAVSAMMSAADSDQSGKVYNVGSGGTYSINRLVELLGGDRVYIPKRPGEPDCTYADISLIRKELGWEPEVSFEDGVREMLATSQEWKEAPVWTPEKIQEATADWFKYLGQKAGS